MPCGEAYSKHAHAPPATLAPAAVMERMKASIVFLGKHVMRTLIGFALTAAIMGCASVDQQSEADPFAAAAPIWNEVPLGAATFREYANGYRTDTIDIPLEPFGELEYKLDMAEGQSIVYQWDVLEMEDPALLYAEFHGHTERVGDAPGTLMFYRKASGGTESGSLVAPFSGIHGWYLKNGTAQPIVVRLNVAGFYARTDQ